MLIDSFHPSKSRRRGPALASTRSRAKTHTVDSLFHPLFKPCTSLSVGFARQTDFFFQGPSQQNQRSLSPQVPDRSTECSFTILTDVRLIHQNAKTTAWQRPGVCKYISTGTIPILHNVQHAGMDTNNELFFSLVHKMSLTCHLLG